MSSATPYEPAPPAPQSEPAALVNGRPMTPRRSYWPDKNPVATARETATSLAGALGLIALPFVVDLLGGWHWQALWMMSVFGVAFLVQAGMDTARPRPEDRTGVWTYRLTHLLLPVVIMVPVLLYGDPLAADVYR